MRTKLWFHDFFLFLSLFFLSPSFPFSPFQYFSSIHKNLNCRLKNNICCSCCNISRLLESHVLLAYGTRFVTMVTIKIYWVSSLSRRFSYEENNQAKKLVCNRIHACNDTISIFFRSCPSKRNISSLFILFHRSKDLSDGRISRSVI